MGSALKLKEQRDYIRDMGYGWRTVKVGHNNMQGISHMDDGE